LARGWTAGHAGHIPAGSDFRDQSIHKRLVQANQMAKNISSFKQAKKILLRECLSEDGFLWNSRHGIPYRASQISDIIKCIDFMIENEPEDRSDYREVAALLWAISFHSAFQMRNSSYQPQDSKAFDAIFEIGEKVEEFFQTDRLLNPDER
jgi:hypothetical protein